MADSMLGLVVVCFLCLVSTALCGVLDNVIHFDQNVKQVDAKGKHWALLVAGSNGWFNYRHQADVCHAYQIMKRHGIPDERIVVMMYDDLAQNEENPTPGIIINHPNGSDVYHGVPKDYTKDEVTPENFLKILKGDKEGMQGIGSGKVIDSGPNDHIFVNFADHGAPGLVAFPDGELHARQWMKVIKQMHRNKKYKQMVIYVEACESGSMFSNLLPSNINVFATTAANSEESSYACYYDQERETYLGDVYSVRWMEDSDKENLNQESLKKQFQIVKKETNTSHVMEYGDLKIASEKVGEFQGGKQAEPLPELPKVPLDAVPSEDVPVAILYHRLQNAKTESERGKIWSKLQKVLKERQAVEDSMKAIAKMVAKDEDQAARLMTVRHELQSFDCYEPITRHYDQYCFDLSQTDYALRHLFVLVNMCEESLPMEDIAKAIYKVCA